MGSTDHSVSQPSDNSNARVESYDPPPGPVDPIEYLLITAAESGISTLDALQYLLQRQMEAITLATANGDVEEVHVAAEGFADLARFFRRTEEEQTLPAGEPLEGARVQLLSVLTARRRSLEGWASRASRFFNLAVKLESDRPFWPGRGATLGSETWSIVHDCMSVITHLAMNLSWLATGNEPPSTPFANGVGLDMRTPRPKLGRLARDLRNIVDGGRRDNSRGRELANLRNTVWVTLAYPWGPGTPELSALSDDAAAAKITADLARRYGEAFGSPSVLACACTSIRKNRPKAQIPAIAADIVWAAYTEANSGAGPVRPEVFRFPIGDDAQARGRARLLKEISKARAPRE